MQDDIITHHVELECGVEAAFDHLSTAGGLEKWLTKKAVVDLAAGGRYDLYWTPDDPDPTNNSTHGCKILAFEKPYYLNVEWKGNAEQKGFMNNVRPLTNVTFICSPLPNGHTMVSVLHTGWRKGSEWAAAREYFMNAWKMAFSSLREVVGKKSMNSPTRNKVIHFEIPVDDMVRARAFYTDAFGWEIQEWPLKGGSVYNGAITVDMDQRTHIPREPGAINGSLFRREEPLMNPVLTLDVRVMEEDLARIEKCGGKIIQGRRTIEDDTHGVIGYIAYIMDPEGNLLGLWENAPRN